MLKMKADLVSAIRNLNINTEYDCLLMFSGGKDSSFLLYFLTQELGLKVMTITLTHNFLSRETLNNIEKFAKKFSKKHITITNNYLNRSGKHFLETWINRPDEESLVTLCTGCRLGLTRLVIETAKEEGINVIVTGLTPFEATDYRIKLVNYPRGKEGIFFFVIGYFRLLARNPMLLNNPRVTKYQLEEYYYYKNQKKIYKRNNLVEIRPFYHYLEYDESKIIETLKKLDWQKAPISTNSYWRADCNMNAIRQFFHKEISGYNEMDHYYGQMLRNNLISREYYEKNTGGNYMKEDIIKILRESKISQTAIEKYEKFLGKKN